METSLRQYRRRTRIALVVFLLAVSAALIFVGHASMQSGSKKLVNVYDRGESRLFLTTARTVKDALSEEGINLDKKDTVEPALDQELLSAQFNVNIYRARPVIVSDGATRMKTTSAYQTPRQIATDAGMTVYDEDRMTLERSSDLLTDGAGLRVSIDRATPVKLNLYGRNIDTRTQATNVKELLEEKNITVGLIDRVSPDTSTLITDGLIVRVWREGVQTVSVDQSIEFGREIVYDGDRPVRYREVRQAGNPGVRSVSYEITVKDGVEVSRKEVASIITKASTPQIEVIGLKNDGSALSLSRGALYFRDSKGVEHRETYYDLPMRVVMGACGAGGYYTVRPDGAKVDRNGYIIVAANYGNYPKCSVVETSMGLGKVYDTGGFAARHPFGFDLATDWTKADGI
jgi:uncharacterized protein YabE (DUF348 family)